MSVSRASAGGRFLLDPMVPIAFLLAGIVTVSATLYAPYVVGEVGYCLPAALVACLASAAFVAWVTFGGKSSLAALLFATTLGLQIQFRTRALGETGLDAQNGAKFATWAIFLVIGIRHRVLVARLLASPAMAFAAAYSSFCLLSAAWSPVPVFTFASAVGNFAYLCLAVACAERVDDRAFMRAIACALAIECLLGMAVGVVQPDVGWLPAGPGESVDRLQGVSGHPNVLAQHAALLLLFALGLRDVDAIGKATALAVAALAVPTLWLTNSRTAMMAAGAAIVASALRARASRLRAVPTVLAVAATATVLFAASGVVPDPQALLSALSRSGDASEITTVTGRSVLWAVAKEHFLERPFLGWGFNGTEDLMAQSVNHAFEGTAVNAHNFVMQGLMSLGVVGFALVLGYFSIILSRFVTRPDPVRDRLMVFFLVLGFGEAEFLTVPLLAIFLVFWALARDASRRGATQSAAASGPLVPPRIPLPEGATP